MKIQYIKGDLFQTDCKYILHGCNAQGVMGSGVAKIVKEKYPNVYSEYHDWCKKSDVLGKALFVSGDLNKIIINAVTQEYYGRDGKRYVSYDAVDDVFYKINMLFEDKEKVKIAMPMIGAGLGGGSWEVISAIIEHRSTNFQPVVYIL